MSAEFPEPEPLWVMSKRAILRRILNVVERTEKYVTAASEYMAEALAGLDSQMEGLKSRLAEDAANLAAALEQADLGAQDSEALFLAAQRVQSTADAVGQLAQPSKVADPQDPAQAEPLPPAEEAPATPAEPTPAEPGGFDPGTDAPSEPETPTPGDGSDTTGSETTGEGTDAEGVDARPGDATAPPEQQTAAPVDMPGVNQE